jgi:hypothetical protein
MWLEFLDKHKASLKLGANQQKNIVQKTKTGLTVSLGL